MAKIEIIKNKQVNNMLLKFEFDTNKKDKIDCIYDSIVYAKKLAIIQLSRLYYLVF